MPWQMLPEYPNGTIGNACIVCHSELRPRSANKRDGHESALSTGIYLDFEGLVVFCESCVIEVANMLGMVTAGAVDSLRKNNRELGRQNKQFRRELEQAKAVIRNLHEIFPK